MLLAPPKLERAQGDAAHNKEQALPARSAKHHPTLYVEVFSQRLHVIEEVRSGIPL